MAGACRSCGFQDYRFVFQDLKYADKRHKCKEKVEKNAQFPFCGQTRAFRYVIVFRGIQPFFFSFFAADLPCEQRPFDERLACFEPTETASRGTQRRMFPSTTELSQMVFYVLWKPVWLIWSCPKIGCLRGTLVFTKVLSGFFVSSESVMARSKV